MMSQLTTKLMQQEFPYKDSIILGDNSSGKSDVLKRIIEESDGEKYYFIDAVNRYFYVHQVIEENTEEIVYTEEINKHRLEESNFNRQDSFYYKGTPRAIEDFYSHYEESLQVLMEEFLGIKFEVKQGMADMRAYIDDREVTLSSGFQAILRMFLEILYYEDVQKEGTIVIDEIDEFLSVKNSGKIFDFLRKKFPTMNWLITTHSADLVANTENANLILIKDETIQILDAGDFSSISQVYDMFTNVFTMKHEKNEKERMDDQLRYLLNNKMSGVWGKEEEDVLNGIKKGNITKVQKLIVKQIEEWH